MEKQIASIADVAKRANVSAATASRVLSHSPYPVRDVLRQRVMQVAQELNYVPNSLARSFRAQRTMLIAMIVGDNADPYFAEMMRGVEEVANEAGYLTIVCNTDRKTAKELHYLRMLQDYRADGVIFLGSGLNEIGYPEQLEKIVQSMCERGSAIVTLASHTLHVPSVQANNFEGARAMAAHLIACGHRRIAYIAGPTNVLAANTRLQGYMTALVEAGITIDPNLIVPGHFDRASGEQAAHTLTQLPQEQRPSAIFAANDETAFGVLSELGRIGWHVPQDISVCGFGDLPMASVVVPGLTTVHIGLRELGRRGARLVLAQLSQQEVPDLENVPVSVIKRGTTAPYVPYTS